LVGTYQTEIHLPTKVGALRFHATVWTSIGTCDIPTEDSSGCAVSLGGDDSPYQSLAGVVDPSSACLKRTAQSVQLVLVVTTVHDSHYTVELMLLAASRQRTPQGVQLVWVMAVILAVS